MLALHTATRKSSLAPELLDLVDYRLSQINACAFCLDGHYKDLRPPRQTEPVIYLVGVWPEVPNLYSSRERAALAWAEAVTRLVDQKVPDEAYEQARTEFTEGVGAPDVGRRFHQRMEQAEYRLPHAGR